MVYHNKLVFLLFPVDFSSNLMLCSVLQLSNGPIEPEYLLSPNH